MNIQIINIFLLKIISLSKVSSFSISHLMKNICKHPIKCINKIEINIFKELRFFQVVLFILKKQSIN
jgi:hypothetical protein